MRVCEQGDDAFYVPMQDKKITLRKRKIRIKERGKYGDKRIKKLCKCEKDAAFLALSFRF